MTFQLNSNNNRTHHHDVIRRFKHQSVDDETLKEYIYLPSIKENEDIPSSGTKRSKTIIRGRN